MTTNISAYRIYLGITSVQQRLEPFNLTDVRISTGWTTVDTEFWRSRVEDELEEGKVPSLYQYGDIQVYPNPPIDWSKPADEREAAQQQASEDFIFEFLRRYPDALVGRVNGSAYIYWEPLEGVGVTINAGRALCERVLVREEYDEVVDPEALEEATRDLPTVKKVRPVYEWRCNDAELAAL